MNKPKFQVGDKVWHPEFGWCKVHDHDPSTKTTRAYWCYIESLKYHRWFGWWELFYEEVELPQPPKPEPEIDWAKVPQGTPVVSKYLGDEIHYLVAYCDHSVFDMPPRWIIGKKGHICMPVKHCCLAPEVEIKEEWLK